MRSRAPAAVLALLLVAAIALAACGTPSFPGMGDHHDAMHGGSDTRGDDLVVAEGDTEVAIEGNAFHPGNLQIQAGATVTWTNLDEVAHTATEDDGEWDTQLLRQGESASITFDEPGVYDYYCIPHPNMRARIEVIP